MTHVMCVLYDNVVGIEFLIVLHFNAFNDFFIVYYDISYDNLWNSILKSSDL